MLLLEGRAGTLHMPPPLRKHTLRTGDECGGEEESLKLSVVFLVYLATLLIAFLRLRPKSMEN